MAVNSPFYASKITTFRLAFRGLDGFIVNYDCANAVVPAIVICAIELMLIGFTCAAVLLYKKQEIEINI